MRSNKSLAIVRRAKGTPSAKCGIETASEEPLRYSLSLLFGEGRGLCSVGMELSRLGRVPCMACIINSIEVRLARPLRGNQPLALPFAFPLTLAHPRYSDHLLVTQLRFYIVHRINALVSSNPSIFQRRCQPRISRTLMSVTINYSCVSP